ncbi:unnamed protein product [Rhizoctonia solani]|uniref:DUF6535 domain-containing protein n=1 Tax=Rhizoctonia solani TaxID=456999 RepID=A0A8H3HKK5_9AGAM|nr:unnamed protein product [Rhizoctonia solani]
MLVPPSKKRGGTATKGLHDYMHKHRKRMQVFYPVEAPQEFDEKGKELGPDAQVWKTYVREADQVDEELVDGWNKSMDVILSGTVLSNFYCIRDRELQKPQAGPGRCLVPDPTDHFADTHLHRQWIPTF